MFSDVAFCDGLCLDPLTNKFMNVACKRQGQISGQFMMGFSHRKKYPFVFKKIECPKKIPYRRQNNSDGFADPAQFPKKRFRPVHMLHGVRTKHFFKLFVCKRQIVNILDQDKIGNLRMSDDICIDSARIDFTAADVQIPPLLRNNSLFHKDITDEIKHFTDKNDNDYGDDEYSAWLFK
jgi:hypothetical protein